MNIQESKQGYIVLLLLGEGGSHQPIFRDDDDNLEFYDTKELAQAAIDEVVQETIEAVQDGDMTEAYGPDDYEVCAATLQGETIQYRWQDDNYIMRRTEEDSIMAFKDVEDFVEEAVQLAAMRLLEYNDIEYGDTSLGVNLMFESSKASLTHTLETWLKDLNGEKPTIELVPPFHNGWRNWIETFYHITERIEQTKQYGINELRSKAPLIEDTLGKLGSAALVDLALRLTNEFEQDNLGRDWADGDYFDSIEEFCTSKFKEI